MGSSVPSLSTASARFPQKLSFPAESYRLAVALPPIEVAVTLGNWFARRV